MRIQDFNQLSYQEPLASLQQPGEWRGHGPIWLDLDSVVMAGRYEREGRIATMAYTTAGHVLLLDIEPEKFVVRWR